jgi:hypothetical protein
LTTSKFLAKSLLVAVGIAFALFCLFLAIAGAIRFHGWIEVGRLAPPQYPGIERFDVISFRTDPLRASLEIGGNLFLILMALSGLAFVIQSFRRGMKWMSNLPYVLPLVCVAAFWATVASVLIGRTDWVLPASLLLGSGAFAMNWMTLRKNRLPINARLIDVPIAPR